MLNPVICPVRNCLSLTRKAVETFRAQDIEGGATILILDNASSDGTVEWLHAQPDLLRAHFHPPKSVASSWNLGLEWAFRRGAEYAFVINNDVEIKPEMYRSLVETGLPFATGVSVSSQEQLCQPFVRSDRERPDFSAFLIRREAWDRVGPFNKEYEGAFYEDNEWHVRAWAKGVHLTCVGFPFLHHASATVKRADPATRKDVEVKAAQNRERFKAQFGCYPATPEYDALFLDSRFGVNAPMTEHTK